MLRPYQPKLTTRPQTPKTNLYIHSIKNKTNPTASNLNAIPLMTVFAPRLKIPDRRRERWTSHTHTNKKRERERESTNGEDTRDSEQMDRGRNEILFWFIHKLFKSELEEFPKVGTSPCFRREWSKARRVQCFTT